MCVTLEIERTFGCKIYFWQKSETEKYNCSEKFTQRDLNLLKTTFISDWVFLRTYEFMKIGRRDQNEVLYWAYRYNEPKRETKKIISFDCFFETLK